MVYRVFFGMEFQQDGLHLHPVIPEELKGSRTLTNFRYRKMTLDIEVRGFGGKIQTVTLDGRPSSSTISPKLAGDHHIVIELNNQPLRTPKLNLVLSMTAPETPVVSLNDKSLTWKPIDGVAHYVVYRDGKRIEQLAGTQFSAPSSDTLATYQVEAVDGEGSASFLSAPVMLGGHPVVIMPTGFASNPEDPIALDSSGKTGSMTASVSAPGRYVLSFRYANGSGPVNTDNKCAVRTLFVDGTRVGPIVMPQRGQDLWSDWGSSSPQIMELKSGEHRIELRLEPYDKNMNGEVNRALIQSMSLERIDHPADEVQMQSKQR
jgi:hypothetical protein